MHPVREKGAAALLPIMQGSIRPDSTITSDLWAAYGGLQAIGYTHLTVNHTKEFVDTVTRAYIKSVDISWKNAKLGNKKQHGAHRTMLDSYLCEWMW